MHYRSVMIAGSAAILLSLLIGLNHQSKPSSQGTDQPGSAAAPVTKNPTPGLAYRARTKGPVANPVVLSSEFTALADQIHSLRSLPFHQHRSWTNRLAIEDALIKMKEMGVTSAAELPKGILEDPLGYLEPARRAEVEPTVARFNERIRDIMFDSLGRALESAEVDELTSLETEREATLGQVLTSEEIAEWTARNTWEGQQLRELPLALDSEQFKSAAQIEHQFKTQAAKLDWTTPDGISELTKLGTWRDQALSQALGSETVADLEKVRQPGYAATLEAGTSHGQATDVSEYLWTLHRWQETSAMQLAEGNWNQLTALQESFREKAHQQLISTLGEPTVGDWMQSGIGAFLVTPKSGLLEQSVETPYQLTDGVESGTSTSF
jgi:hypothetical protein